MFSFFTRKPKSYLGIDIGASQIKIVELEKKEARFELRTYGIFPFVDYLRNLSQQTPFDPLKMPAENLAEAIRRTIKEAGVQSREASFSIPVYHTFCTLLDLPMMPENEIAAAIPFEARKYVPVPVSEVLLDWRIVSLPGKQTGIQVLLVAVPKEIISRYSQIIQLTGLTSRTIEAETFSLARVLIGNDKSAIVLIDSGARSTNISIIDGGYIRIVNNLDIGGMKFSRAISQRMNLDLIKAEEGKKAEFLTPELMDTIKLVTDSIISEVKRVIGAYQEKYGRKIEKCIVVGGGLQVSGLIDYFAQKMGLGTCLANPFARVVYPALLEPALRQRGPSLSVAVGLASREN